MTDAVLYPLNRAAIDHQDSAIYPVRRIRRKWNRSGRLDVHSGRHTGRYGTIRRGMTRRSSWSTVRRGHRMLGGISHRSQPKRIPFTCLTSLAMAHRKRNVRRAERLPRLSTRRTRGTHRSLASGDARHRRARLRRCTRASDAVVERCPVSTNRAPRCSFAPALRELEARYTVGRKYVNWSRVSIEPAMVSGIVGGQLTYQHLGQ